MSTTRAKNLSPVSLTPAISPCHWFSVIAGVVDTGDKFIVDTGDQLSAVTTTPAINLSPVSRTRTPWRWGAAKDRRKLKGINRGYLRPPKSATAADDVIGTAMKSCIHTYPTHLDQRPLRPPKLNKAVLVCSSFGGLRGLRACAGLCAFLWLFQWQYWRPWPTSAAGVSFAESSDLCRNRRCRWHRWTICRRCRWYRSEITKRPKIYRRCHRCQRHRW